MPIDIHVNPHPGNLPPPWFRPPPEVMKGRPRILDSIVSGLLIENEEGRRWFKDTYDYDLASNHSEDLNIPFRLKKFVVEKGIALGCCAAPRRLEPWSDFLIITEIQRGPFINDGPEAYEEVLQEDRRPIPGVKEEQAKAHLKKEFGIETNGYKSYYSNAY